MESEHYFRCRLSSSRLIFIHLPSILIIFAILKYHNTLLKYCVFLMIQFEKEEADLFQSYNN
jgi:hypothetical protein